MASSPSLGPRSGSGRYDVPTARAGASKTQASLARIIGVISTVRPPSLEPPRTRGDERGTGLDLRLRLGLPTEIGGGSAVGEGGGPTARGIAGGDGEVTAAEESISAAESVVGEAPAAKSSDGECDPPKEALEGHGKECSEITNVREGEEEELAKEVSEEGGGAGAGAGSGRVGKASNGYLDLLLEAVREVLGGGGFLDEDHEGAAGADEEEEKMEEAAPASAESRRSSRSSKSSRNKSRSRSRSRRERRCGKSSNPSTTLSAAAKAAAAGGGGGGSKRREASWGGPLDVYEETAPIVRSKRGRSQALPSRYRDSVLEPWTTKPPIVTRHGRAGRH